MGNIVLSMCPAKTQNSLTNGENRYLQMERIDIDGQQLSLS